MEDQIKIEKNNFIKDLLYIIKNNIILMLIVVILVTGCGIGYAYTRQPNYITSYEVSYRETSSSEVRENVNIMMQYGDTVAIFVQQDVVVKRANYYYKKWLDAKNDGKTLTQFISDLNAFDSYTKENGKLIKAQYISASNIGVVRESSETGLAVFYTITYKDLDRQASREKVVLLYEAYSREIARSEGGVGVYFQHLSPEIKSGGLGGTSQDLNKRNIVIIAFVLSIILAVALAYLVNLLDNTVRDGSDLERLTGTKLLSYISEVKGE